MQTHSSCPDFDPGIHQYLTKAFFEKRWVVGSSSAMTVNVEGEGASRTRAAR
jgi:hypothetical protein